MPTEGEWQCHLQQSDMLAAGVLIVQQGLLTNVWRVVRGVCSRQMPVWHPAVVPSVQQPHACYFNLKHAGTQDMPSSVSCHLQQQADCLRSTEWVCAQVRITQT